jgi:hypothetical protein
LDKALSYSAHAAALTVEPAEARTLDVHQRSPVAKRIPRGGAKPAPARQEPKPAAPMERHSGEGSASVLETLQKLESRRRLPARPTDSPSGDDSPS